MYESPITIITENAYRKIQEAKENAILEAVVKTGITVDKEGLQRALLYDRNQYEKGYADGRANSVVHAHWEVIMGEFQCSNCHQLALRNDTTVHLPVLSYYCPYCGAKMDEEVK